MIHGGNVWEGGRPGAWLDFSANLRPEGPPQWAMDAMEKALDCVRYYPDRAMRDARAGLAAYAGVREENILPTCGGIAAIDLAMSLGSGPVRVERVTFGEYATRARAHGRAVVFCDEPCRAGDTMVLCNPNNPTGFARSREEIKSLFDRARAENWSLVVDEAFIDYCPECSARDMACEGLTIVGSLTKILGVPGVRLGYVCGPAEAIAKMEAAALPWQLNALAAALAGEVPRHMDEMRRDAEMNTQRREAFSLALHNLGARVLPSRANFLLCDFGRDMTAAVQALKDKGILVRTCASFGLSPAHIRLAVKTEEENQRLTGELERCLRS